MFNPAGSNTEHRTKHIDSLGDPSLFAARLVAKHEYLVSDKAMVAYWKEWNTLEAKTVWRSETLVEWDTVSAEARRGGKEIHFGYLFGFMVEKGSGVP